MDTPKMVLLVLGNPQVMQGTGSGVRFEGLAFRVG